MRKRIVCVLIRVVVWALQCIYELLKLFPVKDRVCFFSRQSDKVTLDFQLLQQELQEIAPQTESITICHRYRDTRDGVAGFAYDQLRSMYYLATSRVCVLDAYWPAVSMLKHRKELTVIQIWHSIGKIKRSGYQSLGMMSGRDEQLAKILKMHRNYDYIISGGAAWEQYYCEAFDVTADKLRSYGLPRLDWLLTQDDPGEQLEGKYPELKGKKIVLYAPTYRKYPISVHRELMSLFEGAEYALICRFHPNQCFDSDLPAELDRYGEEEIFTLMKACDYLITDYSSLALEGAALEKKTIYYLFDHDQYMQQNGLNIDPADVMPGCTFESAEEVYQAIRSGEYPFEELQHYREKFLPEDLGRSARNIAELIVGSKNKESMEVAV